MNHHSHLISVAPMMGYTDRHMRYFLRLIAKDVRLYTEMMTAQAVIHGDRNRLLVFHPKEHPLALQLGGQDPILLSESAKIGESLGYDEINLNVGCPSDRVKQGQFGACLMLQPQVVAEAIFAMCNRVKIPVTVKCRIGVDDQDSYENLHYFIQLVSEAGCQIFIIHARKAYLAGLSPKENRDIPPLRYDIVRQIKKDFPHLKIIVNGGIQTLAEIEAHLSFVDGVMLGRAICSDPYWLAEIQCNYLKNNILSRNEVFYQFLPYLYENTKNGVKLTTLIRPLLGLFWGEKGARYFRKYLSQEIYKKGAGLEIIEQALVFVND